MEKLILPGTLRGSVTAPPSKSELHRALICAALCDGETVIDCRSPADDVAATVAGLQALGTGIAYRNGKYYVNKIVPAVSAEMDCGESGSTLRFLLPLAAALGIETTFHCHGRLAQRPMEPLLQVLNANGCRVCREGDSFLLRGRLQPGEYTLDASASSQFLTGLLLALPLLPGSSVRLSGTLASKNYVNLTTDVMQRFGVEACCKDSVYAAAGAYHCLDSFVPEGDWSAAAYWLTANALGSAVTVGGLNPVSVQGDRAVNGLIDAIRRGGAEIDAGNVPDLVPPLAVLAALTPGVTRFTNAARLRQKESDRIAALAAMLKALGGDCSETPDSLFVRGVPSLRGGTADSFGDHRIAMAAAVAATVCEAPVTLRGADCVTKSYPAFWSDFANLGGKAE